MEPEKIDMHLDKACVAEQTGDKVEAEKQWKLAVFCEARVLGIDTKMHLANCCPIY